MNFFSSHFSFPCMNFFLFFSPPAPPPITFLMVRPLAGYASTRLFQTRRNSGSCLLEIRYRKILAKIWGITSENKGKKAKGEKNKKKCTKLKNIWLGGNLNSLSNNLPYVSPPNQMQTGNAKDPPLNRPSKCTWKIVLKRQSIVKQSQNGKFPSNSRLAQSILKGQFPSVDKPHKKCPWKILAPGFIFGILRYSQLEFLLWVLCYAINARQIYKSREASRFRLE